MSRGGEKSRQSLLGGIMIQLIKGSIFDSKCDLIIIPCNSVGGVNARLDMFHLKAGQDLPQWMTNELIMADKVLLICDKYYAEKADNRKDGVGWETMIIQRDMLSRQEQNKYIAILRDEDIDRSLPIYVKSRYALNWANEDHGNKEFDELLLFI